jgi:capsid assembly protease
MPHDIQPLADVWAISVETLEAIRAKHPSGLIEPEAKGEASEAAKNPYLRMQVVDGLAVIGIQGPLYAWSYSDAQMALSAAIADDSVKGVVLRVDSPGGTVRGMFDLGDAVASAASMKPVYAHVTGIAASAAYYVASQASQIWSGRAGMEGSLGVFYPVVDESKAAEKAGVKVSVIANKGANLKGADFPGMPVSDELRAQIQKQVDHYFGLFSEGIAKGRKMPEPEVRKLGTGEVWPAGEAQSLGLIDGIRSFAETVQAMREKIAKTQDMKSLKTRALKARAENCLR